MHHVRSLLVALTLAGQACAAHHVTATATTPTAPAPIDAAAIVAATDRTDADRALDAGRHPAELLSFLGLRPGDHVADLMAGGGYTTELLARAVGPTGVVYGQNNPWVLERFAAAPWADRLARPVNANVARLDLELEDPFGDVHDLDVVVMNLFYHDTVWLGVDRPAMNKAILAALKPGGAYVIIDHAARLEAGVKDAQTLHRIEEVGVVLEVTAAGFKLDQTADFLRNPSDTRDWSASPSAAGEKRGTSDRFVLKFRKPLE